MPLKAAPVWALLGPGKPKPESWGLRTDVENLATSGLTKMYLYGEIGYWGIEAIDVVQTLREISGPVEVHINSGGGSVWEGLAIYQALAEHPHDVTVVVDGLAASAASFIAMAGKTIEIGPAAHMMIHNASAFCSGDADYFEAQAAMLRNCTSAIANLYAKRSGKDAQAFIDAMAAETWYIGQEAVDAGLADSVRGEDVEEPALPDNARRETVFNLATLADPPVVRQPPVREDTPAAPENNGADDAPPENSSPGEDEPGDEIDLFEHLDDEPLLSWLEDDEADLFGHLLEGSG